MSEVFHSLLQIPRSKQVKQSLVRRYGILDSEGVVISLNSLARTYPNLVELRSAQELYGLPSVGNETDCPFDEGGGCKSWILTIVDKIGNSEEVLNRLPEILLNGAIAGNERVGPTAVIETAALLLEAAHCESLPDKSIRSYPLESGDDEEWKKQVKEAIKCRKNLNKRGVPNESRKWLARLVTTRRIVIVPIANSWGYYHNRVDEVGIDPRKDFPFSPVNGCFRTVTAKVFQGLFRSHMFQIAVNFHAGEPMIGYPWGSASFIDQSSPDAEAMEQIASAFSVYGSEKRGRLPTGQINGERGPQGGRMEDWAYAGSWTNQVECGEVRTDYDASMLRALPFLVSSSASLKSSHLGSDLNVFSQKSKGNGHIPRMLRLALMAIDVVEPYTRILSANQVEIQDDVVPSTARFGRSCIENKAVQVPKGTEFVTIEWEVGGAFEVDNTHLVYGLWNDLSDDFDGVTHPSNTTIDQLYKLIEKGTVQLAPGGQGRTRWYKQGFDSNTFGPIYSSSIHTQNYNEGDIVALFAVSQVDSSWVQQPKNRQPLVTHQSHLVSARLDSAYFKQNNQKIIQGHIQWFSIPLTIVFGPPNSKIVQEVDPRISQNTKLSQDTVFFINVIALLFSGVIVWTIVAFALLKLRQWHKKSRSREFAGILSARDHDDNVATV